MWAEYPNGAKKEHLVVPEAYTVVNVNMFAKYEVGIASAMVPGQSSLTLATCICTTKPRIYSKA